MCFCFVCLFLVRRMQKGVFSLCSDSLKAEKVLIIRPKLQIGTLRLKRGYLAHLGPEAACLAPQPCSAPHGRGRRKPASTKRQATWATEDVQWGRSCVGKKRQISHSEKFRVVLGRFFWNKICTIDSMASENL